MFVFTTHAERMWSAYTHMDKHICVIYVIHVCVIYI